MILIHYSVDPNFKPCKKQPGGADQKGCFFYPEGKEVEWTNRYRTVWYAPDDLPVTEVNQFDAGEVGNENEVIELFVEAKFLRLLQ